MMEITAPDSCKLVYIGKIIEIESIENADFIVSATVECGAGGKWKGIVKKDQFILEDLCNVFLPDSIIPEQDSMGFMKATNWRVRMRRFKGAPSEVVIIPNNVYGKTCFVGRDITKENGVTKYYKPIPAKLQGIALGDFPGFIPRTDEPNYQSNPDLVNTLVGKPWYMTEKADGSSTTAYRYKGKFGICSRNMELVRNSENGYWKVAEKYKVEERLPEGIAIQWETCGPKIQSNPMGLKDIDGFMFSAYNIPEKRYLSLLELEGLHIKIEFPMVRILDAGETFSKEGVEKLGEGTYSNGKQREGVVVRSQFNYGHKPLSFKVINLDFEK